ncbi:unnamed protein product [Nippostrongylus brasiliensis]|uniref:Uncharacterized protein n=1 Tax=Nippostrongylus brasiliensis TaxID=27835 RepID=A0A0N4YY36_NIPBR|nr:unnamed protein product [Nippostrongylus brasiliensis]
MVIFSQSVIEEICITLAFTSNSNWNHSEFAATITTEWLSQSREPTYRPAWTSVLPKHVMSLNEDLTVDRVLIGLAKYRLTVNTKQCRAAIRSPTANA